MNLEFDTGRLPGESDATLRTVDEMGPDPEAEKPVAGGLTMIGGQDAALCEDGACAVPWLNEGTIDAD